MQVTHNTGFVPFWHINEKNKVIIDNSDFFKFLSDNGFGVVMESKEPKFVHIHNNIVSEVGTTEIKRFVLDFPQIKTDNKISQYLTNRTGIWSSSFLNAVDPVCVDMIRDTAETSYFFYKNGVVTVDKNNIKLKPYSDFNQLIWESNVLDRDYVETAGNDAMFADFCAKLAGDEVDSLKSIIGYCLNRYRTSNNARTVIFEDNEQTGEANGGTGKTMLVEAMAQLRQRVQIDGKRFDPTKDFAWQRVTKQTNIILIDDIASSFRFSDLFNVITGGISVNRKNKPEYYLPVSNGHTIILTTNEVVRSPGNSSQRRQIVFSVLNYFSADRTPGDEYNTIFYSEAWTANEWAKFDNFMLECVQLYHKQGIIKQNKIPDPRKDAIRITSKSFVDWIEENLNLFNGDLTPTGLRDEYKSYAGIKTMNLSVNKFRKWVELYCELMGHQFEDKHTGQQRSYIIDRFNEKEKVPF
jgi:hypothetical protein